MTTPIKALSVEVDRSSESDWIEVVNTELSKPWGPEETERCIGIKDAPQGMLLWLKEAFSQAGWKCDINWMVGPKPRSIWFKRPYPAEPKNESVQFPPFEDRATIIPS